MLILRWRNWLDSLERERRRFARSHRFLPRVECLEDRRTPAATITVNTVVDGAVNADTLLTLREAIQIANGTLAVGSLSAAEKALVVGTPGTGAGDRDTINFNIAGAGPHTIQLTAALPAITDAVFINGTSEPSFSGKPVVELDGTNAGASDGLVIDAAGSAVRALIINRFSLNGILVNATANNTLIQGSYIGLSADGTAAQGNKQAGIQIHSSDNTIGGTKTGDGNVISGNGTLALSNHSGIDISTGDRNLIQGNIIGLNAAGTAALGNFFHGIHLGNENAGSDSDENTIGGATTAARNIISGNGQALLGLSNAPDGIEVERGDRNLIQGNYIGTDKTGAVDLGNLRAGVQLATNDNTMGGNLISGNDAFGVFINDHITNGNNDASGNRIVGNLIGTNAAGTAAIGNALGIELGFDAHDNSIGGTLASERNVISGNHGDGILFGDFAFNVSTGTNNQVLGNYIGTNLAGSAALANAGNGIHIVEDSDGQIIGDDVAGARNIISGNNLAGISIKDKAGGILIQNNFIGTDVTGKLDLGNGRAGVEILSTGNNTIGGSTPLAGNIISGNGQNKLGFEAAGISISGTGAKGNLVLGNYVGLDVTGTQVIANTRSGIEIVSAPNNTIGGTSVDERNVISGNLNVGVAIYGSGATHNLVRGNFIGTDATGALDRGNVFQGVYIGDGKGFTPSVNGIATDNTVGGLTATPGTGPGNLISGNDQNGVWINGGQANAVLGNLIGTDITGAKKIANGFAGVTVDGSKDNTIGGTVTQARNIVSGNVQNGVAILNTGADSNLVQNNYVGTDITGTKKLGNLQSGVAIGQNATKNSVLNNVLSANGTAGVNGEGVEIASAGAEFNVVQGNYIGTDASGLNALGNLVSGVQIVGGAANNTIGGSTTAARNIIAANGLDGVNIIGSDTASNVVAGNYIGTDINGTSKLGNARHGVAIRGGAFFNTIGGSVRGSNLISGNLQNGVQIDGGSSLNLVASNYIGTDNTGLVELSNLQEGVHIDNAGTNFIGGATAAERNLISGNRRNGVLIEGSDAIENFVQGNFIGVDATGATQLGNFLDGVVIQGGANNNVIGGNTQPTLAGGLGNVISGNNFGGAGNNTSGGVGGATGVLITGSGTNFNGVLGNFIGVDVSGALALPNKGDGVAIANFALLNFVGGIGTEGNVISANTGNGVGIYSSAAGNHVQGNVIGSDVGGTTNLGNSLSGVFIRGASFNDIGGSGEEFGNLIAWNELNGVTVVAATGQSAINNTILTNRIFNNGRLGIDLRNDGVTANDFNDPDSGPNFLQNFPLILNPISDGTGANVVFHIQSTPHQGFLIQFFSNTAQDGSGHGEGEQYLGETSVVTDSDGFASGSVNLGTILKDLYISATATFDSGDGLGSTSEFSGETFSGGEGTPPPSSPPPGPSPVDPTQLDPPPEPVFPPETSGGGLPKFAINLFLDGNAPERLLQSLAEAQQPGGGSGESQRALLGALFNGEIGGGMFDDFNGNGKLDPHEPPLVGQIVYLDANDNGKLDDDEWWTITNKRGEYRFQNLPPGRYIVRPVTMHETTISLIDKGYAVKRMPPMLTTAPVTGRQQAELTSQQRSVIDLNFNARVRPDVRPFTPINPAPDKTTPTGPQGRLDPETGRAAPPVAERPVEVEAEAAERSPTPSE